MIVKEKPFPDIDGNFTVQILEQFSYNGRNYHITKDEKIPARLIDFTPIKGGYEVSFDQSFMAELELDARNKGFSIYVHPKFSF